MEQDSKKHKLNHDQHGEIVLLSHLISICQNHDRSSFVAEFEKQAQELSSTFKGNMETFQQFLLLHPSNLSIKSQIAEKEIKNISWELLLCLMSFTWESVAQLSKQAIEYFGDKNNLWKLMILYNDVVITKTNTPELKTYSTWIENNVEILEDIQLFSQLIPMRANNSIVSIAFEDEMSKLTFGNWNIFGTYLKSHPANQTQFSTSIDDISFINSIRLMRNIFCHEQYFDWRNLKEFSNYAIQYFGDREMIKTIFGLYRKCCRGNLQTDSKEFLFEAPSIQLKHPENFGLINRQGKLFIFCGMKDINKFVNKNESKFLDFKRNDILITGGTESGKSTTAKIIAYQISTIQLQRMDSIFSKYHLLELDFQSLENNYSQLIKILTSNLILEANNDSEVGDEEKFKENMKRLIKSFEETDCVVWVLCKHADKMHPQLISFMQELKKEYKGLHLIFTAYSNIKNLNSITFSAPNVFGKQAMSDLQRLIRYYYGIDKYMLRKYISQLSDSGCTALCKFIEKTYCNVKF